MDRTTAETDQTIRQNSTRRPGRRRAAVRATAGMAAFALTGSLGVAGAHASTPEPAAAQGVSQEEYLEMLEDLVQQLEDLEGFEDFAEEMEEIEGPDEDEEDALDDADDEDEGFGDEDDEDLDEDEQETGLEEDDDDAGSSEDGFEAPLGAQELEDAFLEDSELPSGWEAGSAEVIFDETMTGGSFYKNFAFDGLEADPACLDAMQEIDEMEEDAEAAVTSEAENGEAELGTMLVSTPEEHDFFEGYYEDVVEECGTIRFEGAEIEFQPTRNSEGVQVRMENQGEEQWFYMAGQSYGNNHALLVADSQEEIEDFEDILADQLEKLEEEIG